MQVKIYWLSQGNQRLGIMSRPRGGDWLEDELASLHAANVDVLVSLLDSSEIKELELGKEQEYCERIGIHFFNFPIEDRCVPSSTQAARKFIDMLMNLVSQGKSVVIHCRQGVGRSALVTAAILMMCGLSAEDAFEKIEKARGCKVPDTQEQRDWVGRFSSSF